jgi:hypothetical protein
MSHEAAACRKLWAEVISRALDDWNTKYNALRREGKDGADVLTEVSLYFHSIDGHMVCAGSGVDVTPQRAVAVVSMPRDAYRERFAIKGDVEDLPVFVGVAAPSQPQRPGLPPLMAPDRFKGRMNKHTCPALRTERAEWAADAGRRGYSAATVGIALGMATPNALRVMRQGGWNGERNA